MYLVLGGSGNLGHSVCALLRQKGIKYVLTDSHSFNAEMPSDGKRFIEDLKPEKIINCVAYTDVDGCEKNPGKAFAINTDFAGQVARAAKHVGAKLVHISTDYVFGGEKKEAYLENDEPDAIQTYGTTKAIGDEKVLYHGGVVARVQWILGYQKKNFVTWIVDSLKTGTQINLSNFQYGGPTTCKFLAEYILMLADSKESHGIYHLTQDDYVNRYQCGLFIAEWLNINPTYILNPVDHVNFGVAKRPVNTMLSNKRFKEQFCIQEDWSWSYDLNGYLREKYG